MQTATFVKLINLLDVVYEEETQEQRERWVRNVMRSVGKEGYTLDDAGDSYTVKEFATDEIEFVTVDCYYFMGSAYEQERFYAQDFICVMEKATGDYYAYETQEIFEGAF